MNYDGLIGKMMQQFSTGDFLTEVNAAKKQFFESAGVFDEYSTDFEQKMSQFVDWFLFSRPFASQGSPPIKAARNGGLRLNLNPDEVNLLENLDQSRHSLFEFLKTKNSDVYLRDLFANEKLVLKNSAVTIGFEKDQIFEARLIPFQGNHVFTLSFCFHPPKATKYILKEIKRVRKIKNEEERQREKETLIMKLFKMRYKFEQYRHVDIKEIYTNEPRLRI
jgi:hypothetical protein